jgi:hypothetical protein
MALALAAGAAIAAAGYTAASKDANIDLINVQYSETRTKGIMDTTYKGPLAFTGALNAFAPYPAPPRGAKTVLDVEKWYAQTTSDVALAMARYNMRPKGGNQRIPIASADNTPFLVQKAKQNGGLGFVKNSDGLNLYPMTTTRKVGGVPGTPIGWALIKRGEESGYNNADDASHRYRPPANVAKNYSYNFYHGVTFSDRINPWTRSSNQVTAQAKTYADAQGRRIPSIGNLVPIVKAKGRYASKSFTNKV